MVNIAVDKELYGSDGAMKLSVDLCIEEGSFVALAGKSGSGKTTLMRILAGLEEAQGEISLGQNTWLSQQSCIPTQKRQIGFVFQDYALFDNMNVLQNLLYVRKDLKLAKKLLDMTELSSLQKHFPNTLSGGQKQRVSLCRAMMNEPRLLLMDEPLSALDPSMRSKLQNEILLLHKEFGTTTIMVSHDPSEIYRLAQRVIVLEQGRVIQDGNPKDILLKTSGSQKFSFEGELLDITRADLINIAIIAIGQQLVEVVISKEEAKDLHIGQVVRVSTKAFSPMIS